MTHSSDPIFEALGLSQPNKYAAVAGGSTWGAQQGMMNICMPGTTSPAPSPHGAPAWLAQCAQAAAVAAAAAAAAHNAAAASASSPGHQLVLPDVLPVEASSRLPPWFPDTAAPGGPSAASFPPAPAAATMEKKEEGADAAHANEPQALSNGSTTVATSSLAASAAPQDGEVSPRLEKKDAVGDTTKIDPLLCTPPKKSNFNADAPVFVPIGVASDDDNHVSAAAKAAAAAAVAAAGMALHSPIFDSYATSAWDPMAPYTDSPAPPLPLLQSGQSGPAGQELTPLRPRKELLLSPALDPPEPKSWTREQLLSFREGALASPPPLRLSAFVFPDEEDGAAPRIKSLEEEPMRTLPIGRCLPGSALLAPSAGGVAQSRGQASTPPTPPKAAASSAASSEEEETKGLVKGDGQHSSQATTVSTIGAIQGAELLNLVRGAKNKSGTTSEAKCAAATAGGASEATAYGAAVVGDAAAKKALQKDMEDVSSPRNGTTRPRRRGQRGRHGGGAVEEKAAQEDEAKAALTSMPKRAAGAHRHAAKAASPMPKRAAGAHRHAAVAARAAAALSVPAADGSGHVKTSGKHHTGANDSKSAFFADAAAAAQPSRRSRMKVSAASAEAAAVASKEGAKGDTGEGPAARRTRGGRRGRGARGTAAESAPSAFQ